MWIAIIKWKMLPNIREKKLIKKLKKWNIMLQKIFHPRGEALVFFYIIYIYRFDFVGIWFFIFSLNIKVFLYFFVYNKTWIYASFYIGKKKFNLVRNCKKNWKIDKKKRPF